MKKLVQEIRFTDTKEITISELRKNPGEVLTQVEMGRSFNVTRNGKIVVCISKPEPNAFELGAAVRKLGLASNKPFPEEGSKV